MDNSIKLYQTNTHSCSYLENQQAQTLFVDPEKKIDQSTYTYLTELGFRRSGDFIYRPNCENCRACIPARIIVDEFVNNRSRRRVMKRNRHLISTCVKPFFSEEHYSLFKRYIDARHSDGDMYPTTREQYNSFLVEGLQNTLFMEFRDNDELVALAVTDELGNGLSSVYTYFDPDRSDQSLGVYTLLRQITLAKEKNLRYLYLGYWIQGCKKMSYKIQYKPLELLLENKWILLK